MYCKESNKYLLNPSLVAQILNTDYHKKQQAPLLLLATLYSGCYEVLIGPQGFVQLVVMVEAPLQTVENQTTM